MSPYRLALELHHWRERYNGDHIGYGADELFGDQTTLYEFPHAYAVWGSGYVHLYRATGDREHLSLARSCAEWLTANRAADHHHYCWGMPFDWEGYGRNTCFAITTLYAARLFLELYAETGDEDLRKVIDSIRRWLLEENGYNIDLAGSHGLWFHYGDTAELCIDVHNVTAQAASFLSRLARLEGDGRVDDRYYAAGAVRHLLARQLPSGGWPYDEACGKLDLLHHALVMEGLGDCLACGEQFGGRLEEAVAKGMRFLQTRLIDRDGFGYESAPIFCRGRSRVVTGLVRYGVALGKRLLLSKAKLETRSYGYGLVLSALAKAVPTPRGEAAVLRRALVSRLLQLRDADGAFRFSPVIGNKYIRAQAHLFEGLAQWATPDRVAVPEREL